MKTSTIGFMPNYTRNNLVKNNTIKTQTPKISFGEDEPFKKDQSGNYLASGVIGAVIMGLICVIGEKNASSKQYSAEELKANIDKIDAYDGHKDGFITTEGMTNFLNEKAELEAKQQQAEQEAQKAAKELDTKY